MTNGIDLSVLSAVAQQERITLSERTKAGLQRAKHAGRTLGRRTVGDSAAQSRWPGAACDRCEAWNQREHTAEGAGQALR
jgi:DNA invertase Pin-like site-specific DNA recombinase